MSLTVTANTGGNASPGILLRVLVLDNATLPATLNTAVQTGLGTHDVSITPAQTGSLVYSVEFNYNATVTAPAGASGNTIVDAVVDTTSNSSYQYGYGTFWTTGTAGTALTAGSTDSGNGGAAALEIRTNGVQIGTEGSSPPPVVGRGLTSVTTAAFTPSVAGTLILALVSAAGSPYGNANMTVTDSYGLTWTEAVAANTLATGYAGIWYAYAPPALSLPAQTLTGGVAGAPYVAPLTTTGGYPPYTYTLASGSLPAGLSLTQPFYFTPIELISGTPTTAGTSTFTFSVTDSFGNSATSGTQTLTIANPPNSPYVAGTWTGAGVPYAYGTTALSVGIQEHDWAIVVASWTFTEDRAVAFVSDNAHNVYRPLALSNFGAANIQAWAVPNAKAASSVYVSTSGFVRSLTITVLDVKNMAAGYAIDAIVPSANGNTNSGWTMNLTTTRPDLVIAAGVSEAITTLPAAWNPVYSYSIPTSGNQGPWGMAGQVVGWQDAVVPGAVSAPFSIIEGVAYSVPYAGMLIAIAAQAAPVISAPNPAWPNIRVQAAFGYSPGSPTGLPTWTDISSRFRTLSGQRGRSFELDELSAADLVMELDNFDGALSPQNQNSPYWPNVRLITPIQVLADWQGRRYSLFYGLLTAIPQTFDFERGVVKVHLSDDYSKLPQILLPSCMIAELLYDNPLHLWPLNEQAGAGMASNWSGRSTSVLVATKGKYGGGLTGNTPNTGFGNTAAGGFPTGLEGSTDTCWGNNTGAIGSNYVKGTVLVNRHDPSLPWTATGATYEFWANWANNAANVNSAAIPIVISDDKGTNGGGDFLHITLLPVDVGGPANAPIRTTVFSYDQRGLSWYGRQAFSVPNLFDNHWHHYAITVLTNGTVAIYLDGNRIVLFKGRFPAGSPNRLMLGGDVTVNPIWQTAPSAQSQVGGGFGTGMISHVAVYDRAIDPERIQSHYQSGKSGFVNEASGQRIQRVLQYAKWSGPQAIENGVSHMQIFNYLGQGYASAGLGGAIGQYGTAGGGYNDMGAQSDVTIQDIANSECGFLFVSADGTLTFRERDTAFNQVVTGSIGDQDTALNFPTTFANGLQGWLASGNLCTVAPSSAWSYAGGQSALITVSSSGNAYPAVPATPVTPGQVVGASAWVMSPGGATVQFAIDWFNGTSYVSGVYPASVWCPPMTPVLLQINPTAVPAGVNLAHLHPTIPNQSAGTQLYVDHIRLSPSGFQVPYQPDVEVTEDIQYLFNDIAITRNVDQALYRVKDDGSRNQYYPRVYTRTIYTSMEDPQAMVDVANWLLDAYTQPKLRVSQVTIDAASNPDAWPFVLGTDIGDIVSFSRTPVQGAPAQGAFLVLSIEPDISGGDENTPPKAQFKYVLAPSPGAGILTLDDPVYGVIGGSNELGW